MSRKKRINRELLQCVDELRSLDHLSPKEYIDEVIEDGIFHLKELMAARRCDVPKIEALDNLINRGIALLEHLEKSETSKGAN